MNRSSLRGLAIGLLGLAIFDGIVSRPSVAAATGGAWKFATDALNAFLNPQVTFFKVSHAVGKAPVGAQTATTANQTGAPPTVVLA